MGSLEGGREESVVCPQLALAWSSVTAVGGGGGGSGGSEECAVCPQLVLAWSSVTAVGGGSGWRERERALSALSLS